MTPLVCRLNTYMKQEGTVHHLLVCERVRVPLSMQVPAIFHAALES